MRKVRPYGRRDRIAGALCNWIMRHVASERYRKMIGGSVRYGLAAAARDEAEKREPPWPPPWFSSITKDAPRPASMLEPFTFNDDGTESET